MKVAECGSVDFGRLGESGVIGSHGLVVAGGFTGRCDQILRLLIRILRICILKVFDLLNGDVTALR